MQPVNPGLAPQMQEIQFPTRNSVSFDLRAFNDAIAAHGVTYVHYRAMVNPVGMIDINDVRRPDPDSPNASNGMYYTKAGTFLATLIGNTKEVKASDGGLTDSSTAQMTPQTHYLCNDKRVYLAPYDRLYLEEESVLVTRHEKVEFSPTGIDRPKFPPVEIVDCVDARGIRYNCSDFEVKNGMIYWLGNRPGLNPETNKGVVYAIRYLYRPHWYVQRLVHEIRVIQQPHPLTGARTTSQAPQSAIVQREFVFQNEATDTGTINRGVLPADGSLPAR